MERIRTGIQGLDEILGGGFTKRSVNLISGKAGTGKTIFALDFIFNGAKFGETGLFITFEETVENLSYHFGANRAKDMNKHMEHILVTDIATIRLKVNEGKGLMSPNHIKDSIRSIVSQNGVTRVALDSISALSSTMVPAEFRNLFFEITNLLKELGVTAIITTEVAEGKEFSRYEVEEFIADSIIKLSRDGSDRFVRIEKMRGVSVTPLPQVMHITGDGISISPDNTHFHEPVRKASRLSLGISELDRHLGGGVEKGAVMLFCIDSDSYDSALFVPFALAAMQECAARGDAVVNTPLSEMTPLGVERFAKAAGETIGRLAESNRIHIVDWAERDVDKALAGALKVYSHDDKIMKLLDSDLGTSRLFWTVDLVGMNELIDWNAIKKVFSYIEKRTKAEGGLAMVSLNPSLVEPTFLEYMKTVSTHIIYIFRRGKYNYLEVTKNRNGKLSYPAVVRMLPNRPYISIGQ